MIPNLPVYIPFIFGLTTLLTFILLYILLRSAATLRASVMAGRAGIILAAWLALQAVLSLGQVYSAHTEAIPPRIMLIGILPCILFIVIFFISAKGRAYADSLSLKKITGLHIVRVPVELVLYWLSLHQAVPVLMTFEGRNFDILAGITAPLMAIFFCSGNKTANRILLGWNIAALLLLINIIANAILSAPGPLQRFAFEQPNIAILYFPFSWLPVFIVPAVLFGHLVSIRQLWRSLHN
jgi:hypothetical protein